MDRPEVVRLYRVTLRALDAAQGALAELSTALAPGEHPDPLRALARAAADRAHESMYWLHAEFRAKGALFGDRERGAPVSKER